MASVFSKRLCCSSDISRASQPEELDKLLETLLGFTDVSSGSLNSSLDRLLESRSCGLEKNQLIEKALRLGSSLQEAAKKCERKRASLHNSMTWPLPPDLSVNSKVKVFIRKTKCTLLKSEMRTALKKKKTKQ